MGNRWRKFSNIIASTDIVLTRDPLNFPTSFRYIIMDRLINEMKSCKNTDDDDDHPFPSCNYLLSGHVEFLHEAWLNGVFGISKRLLNLSS